MNVTNVIEGPPSIPAVVATGGDPNDFDNDSAGPTSGTMTATNGPDTLVGTSTPNTINGNDGGDTIYGKGGNDNLSGNNGADIIYGQAGDDTITGNNQNDTIYGGSGGDSANGGEGADSIYGGTGNDSINGGIENDFIYAGSGNDTINGAGGNDTVVGGFGADLITAAGNDGNDTFKYLSASDTGDTITGFQQGSDTIDIAAVDGSAGTSPFTFGGQSQNFTTGHSVTWYRDLVNSRTVVQVDTDGNLASAELVIYLASISVNLVQTDFAL